MCVVIYFTYKKSYLNFTFNLLFCIIERQFIINDLGIFFDGKSYFDFYIDKLRNSVPNIRIRIFKQTCSDTG